MIKSPVWTHFQVYGIAFSHFQPPFCRTVWAKNSEKKIHSFLSVKPIIWAIICWNLSLETPRIAYCTTSKVLKSRFFLFKLRFWRRIWTKNWKKFQMFSLIASIDGVNFEIFHSKYHTWKNNNQIAKNGNVEPLYRLGNPLWSRQSANVGFLYGSISTRIYRTHFGHMNFLLTAQC